MARPAFLLVLALLLASSEMRGGEADASLVPGAVPAPDQTVQIDFQLTFISEPASLSAEELAQQLADYRAKLLPDRPGLDHEVDSYRKTLTERIEEKSDEHLVMAPTFTAIHSEQPRGLTFWDIRHGADCYLIYSNDQISLTSGPAKEVRRTGDMARAVLEISAKRASQWVNDQTGGNTKLSRTSDQTTVQRGSKTVILAVPGGQLIATEEASGPRHTDRVEYANYRDFAGVTFPSKITRTVTNPEGGQVRFIYEIKKVTFSEDPKVPTVSEEVGLVQVFDSRFTPPIRYQAFRTLPDRPLVETWIKDPAALEKHDAEAQSAAFPPKPWWQK